MELNENALMSEVQNETAPKEATAKYASRIKFVTDSVRGNITFLPTISDDFKGLPFAKLWNVRETLIRTSLIQKGYGWCYVLSKDMYGELTPEQSQLYDEVVALWDKVNVTKDAEGNTQVVDFSYARKRNYTLCTGIVTKHTNVANEELQDSKGPAILEWPSLGVAKAIAEAIQMEKATSNGDSSFIKDVFNNNAVGREAALAVSFKKKGGNAVGYDTTCSILFNSPRKKVIDPTTDFGEENIKLTMNPIKEFLTWSFDEANNARFNEQMFRELKLSLEDREKGIKFDPNSVSASNQQPAPAAAPTQSAPAAPAAAAGGTIPF